MQVISRLLRTIALTPLLVLCACGGGDAPAAPTGFTVTAGDARVLVEWDYLSNLTYDMWWKEGAGVVARDANALSMLSNVYAPAVVSFWKKTVNKTTTTYYLENDGTSYSFVMNARNSGGPAGASTASLTATPRYAGDTWTQKNAAGATGGIASGVTLQGAASNAHVIAGDGNSKTNPLFVTVGSAGAIYVSKNAADWTVSTSGSSQSLNAAAYGVNSSNAYYFVVVGDAGTILRCNYETDDDAACSSWSAASSVPVSSKLNDVASGEALYVAVGEGGVILSSSDGNTWTQRTSGTTQNLNGVSYFYDEDLDDGYFVAVGAGGTVLTSTDAVTWTARTSGTSKDLYAVTYGIDRSVTSSSVYYWVAVGAGGTVISARTATASWADQSAYSGTTQDLYSVAKGTRSRFVAAGASGTLIYSLTPGSSWTSISTGSSAQVNKLMFIAPVILPSYLAVGDSGSNLLSK
jgi:photosystem II stability/assembly factor-like uncharacterized protein